MRRFIPNFGEIVKSVTNMLRKHNGIKWTLEARMSFENIKKALIEALVLMSPYLSNDFLIFSFASHHTIAGVLLEKNEHNLEHPIAFYSRELRDSSLKYNIMEKQAYALVKPLTYFRVYILHSHVTSFVPNNVVKDNFTQLDSEG